RQRRLKAAVLLQTPRGGVQAPAHKPDRTDSRRARPVLLDNGRRRRDASLDHAAGLFPGLWVRAGRVAVAAHPAPAVSVSVGAKPEPRWNVAVPKPCCKEQHIQSPHAVRPFSIACRERDNTQSVTKPSLPTFGA